MEVNDIITKWELNNSFLAKKLCITKQAFSLKIRGIKQYEKFTEPQIETLKKLFKELVKDINKVK